MVVPKHLFGVLIAPCKMAEEDHAKSKRQYAHTIHFPKVICVARSIFELPDDFFMALIAHEYGHIHCQEVFGPDHTEEQADAAAHVLFGAPIEYVDSPYGERLEHLRPGDVDRVAKRLARLQRG